MTKINLLSVASILTLMSCGNHETKLATHGGSFELNGNQDTINRIDASGMKQGLWLMPISKDTVVYLNGTAHSVTTITSGEMIRLINQEGNRNVVALPDSFAVKSQSQ